MWRRGMKGGGWGREGRKVQKKEEKKVGSYRKGREHGDDPSGRPENRRIVLYAWASSPMLLFRSDPGSSRRHAAFGPHSPPSATMKVFRGWRSGRFGTPLPWPPAGHATLHKKVTSQLGHDSFAQRRRLDTNLGAKTHLASKLEPKGARSRWTPPHP